MIYNGYEIEWQGECTCGAPSGAGIHEPMCGWVPLGKAHDYSDAERMGRKVNAVLTAAERVAQLVNDGTHIRARVKRLQGMKASGTRSRLTAKALGDLESWKEDLSCARGHVEHLDALPISHFPSNAELGRVW